MADIWFEVIGWIGLSFCIGAYLIKQMTLLRTCSLIGTGLMAIYYGHLHVQQGLISNLLVFGVNFTYLLHAGRQHPRKKKKSQQLA